MTNAKCYVVCHANVNFYYGPFATPQVAMRYLDHVRNTCASAKQHSVVRELPSENWPVIKVNWTCRSH